MEEREGVQKEADELNNTVDVLMRGIKDKQEQNKKLESEVTHLQETISHMKEQQKAEHKDMNSVKLVDKTMEQDVVRLKQLEVNNGQAHEQPMFGNNEMRQNVDKQLPDDVLLAQKQMEIIQLRLEMCEEELAKKDALLNGKTEETILLRLKDNKEFDAIDILTKELTKTREKTTAVLQHNAKLITQVQNLEAEKAIKTQTIAKLNKDIHPQTNSPTEDTIVNDLKNKYFCSLAMGLKLQGSLMGLFSNVDITLLYDKAISENIPLNNWPEWVSNQIQSQSMANPKGRNK